MSITTSIRLDKEFLEEIDSRCNTLCCTRNDFIKSAIKSALGSKEDDVTHKPYHDSFGNRFYWDYNDKEWVCEVNAKNVRAVP